VKNKCFAFCNYNIVGTMFYVCFERRKTNLRYTDIFIGDMSFLVKRAADDAWTSVV